MKQNQVPKGDVGLSLLEVVLFLVITSALFIAAMITFYPTWERSHSSAIVQELVSTLQWVKSESIRQQGSVKLCVLSQQLKLADKSILQIKPPYHLEWKGGPRDCITFLPYGGTNGQRGSIVVFREDRVVQKLTIVESGRIRLVSTKAVDLSASSYRQSPDYS